MTAVVGWRISSYWLDETGVSCVCWPVVLDFCRSVSEMVMVYSV